MIDRKYIESALLLIVFLAVVTVLPACATSPQQEENTNNATLYKLGEGQNMVCVPNPNDSEQVLCLTPVAGFFALCDKPDEPATFDLKTCAGALPYDPMGLIEGIGSGA